MIEASEASATSGVGYVCMLARCTERNSPSDLADPEHDFLIISSSLGVSAISPQGRSQLLGVKCTYPSKVTFLKAVSAHSEPTKKKIHADVKFFP